MVDAIPVDVEAEREWANAYRSENGLSWSKFGEASGVPSGTLQPFCTGKYAGDNERIAREIARFRHGVAQRSEKRNGLPVDPGYFETPSSLLLWELLAVASSGEITLGAFAPGLGKTRTAEQFMSKVSPVYMLTLEDVTKDTKPMLRALAQAIGINIANLWPDQISAEIRRVLNKRKATIIVDEANHATMGTLEQLRQLNDKTGVGICLLGNEELLFRIEKNRNSQAYSRLNGRIYQRVVQNVPLEGDVTAFCAAWQLHDPKIIRALRDVALFPGSGGLRECRQIIVRASRLAAEDGGSLEYAHVRWAIEKRAVRNIVS